MAARLTEWSLRAFAFAAGLMLAFLVPALLFFPPEAPVKYLPLDEHDTLGFVEDKATGQRGTVYAGQPFFLCRRFVTTPGVRAQYQVDLVREFTISSGVTMTDRRGVATVPAAYTQREYRQCREFTLPPDFPPGAWKIESTGHATVGAIGREVRWAVPVVDIYVRTSR